MNAPASGMLAAAPLSYSDSPFHQQREEKLLALARAKFDASLTQAEKEVVQNCVHPGPATLPRGVDATSTGRTVRGSFLRWLASDTDAYTLIDPNGIWVMAATLLGDVDLSSMHMLHGLTFDSCIFRGQLVLVDATTYQLDILRCTLLEGIDVRYMQCSSSFTVDTCNLHNELNFYGVRVAANMMLLDSVANVTGDWNEMDFDRCNIANDFQISRLDTNRSLTLVGVTLGGDLQLTGTRLACTRTALLLDGANIQGSFLMDRTFRSALDRFECFGDITARHMQIGQDIKSLSSLFHKPHGIISFEGAIAKSGGIQFSDLICYSQLDFSKVQVGADVNLESAQILLSTFSNFWGAALSFRDASIGKGLKLNSLNSEGLVDLSGAMIEGDVECSDAHLTALSMSRTHVKGSLSAAKTVFSSKDRVIQADATQIDGAVSLINAFCSGTVVLQTTKIGADLNVSGARFNLPATVVAIGLSDTSIGGQFDLSTAFQTLGTVSMTGGSVGGNVIASSSAFASLTLNKLTVTGDLYWLGLANKTKTRNGTRGTAGLYLYDTTVNTLYDDTESWPPQDKLGVNGFKYHALDLRRPPSSAQASANILTLEALQPSSVRIDWLKLQNSDEVTAAQPWQELADFYERRNSPNDSKNTLYLMGRVKEFGPSYLWRCITWPYDKLVETPLDITWFIAGLWFVGSIVFWRARRMEAMAPRDKDVYKRFMSKDPIPEYVPFNPVIYALENVLPVVKFGQDDAWAPNPAVVQDSEKRGWQRWAPRCEYRWLAALRWTMIVLGWALALILAGAIGARFKT